MSSKSFVNAGIHPKFALKRFDASEKTIINKLKVFWYVTSSGESLQIKNSTYDYFLIKPTTQFTEKFNLNREIVCLFSPYTNFEPRTLDVFDDIFQKLPKSRVENLCSILISKDNNVEELVKKLSNSDPEQKLIIPFTYDEIYHNANSELYDNRFRKVFYSRDLFAFKSPLKKDSYFFGRANLVHELISKHNSGEHAGIFGLRKSGKTSIVYAIQRKLEIEKKKCLMIDCESPSIHKKRWYELLEDLVLEYKTVKDSKIKIEFENRYDEKNAAKSFEEDILKIYESKKHETTLFIFDEIERISPGTASSDHWSNDKDFIYFWQTLRAFYQKYPLVYTYMLVGTNPKCIEESQFFNHDNPIYLSCSIHYLPNFSIDQVIEMVDTLGRLMGLNFEADICAKLYNDCGGHPFLIRQMCSFIHTSYKGDRPFKVDKGTYTIAFEAYQANLEQYFDMMLNILCTWYPDEYEMLIMLALEDNETFIEFAKDNKSLTQHLLSFGLVEKHYNQKYMLTLESLGDYLKNKNRFKKITLSDEEKLQEISLRRNRLEKKLRELILNGLKFAYGKKAQEELLKAIPEDRREKLKSSSINNLLSNNTPLFFIDLRNIFNKNWEKFSNLLNDFEKSKFLMILDEINKYRVDAHAKDIDETDFKQIRIYFDKLESLLEY